MGQDTRDARETRDRLRQVLEQYPPSVREVLRIDPSLLTRADYLATYPVLWSFLERHPEVAEISMSLPNLHHWTVDLSPFGIDNDREVYVSTTEPHGLIEGTIRRSD